MRKLLLLVFLMHVTAAGSCNTALRVEIAMADLAKRLEIQVSQISIVAVTVKTWNNSSLGCPQPSMEYRQVLIDGSSLTLEVAGRHYYYHARGAEDYFFCAHPKSSGSSYGDPS